MDRKLDLRRHFEALGLAIWALKRGDSATFNKMMDHADFWMSEVKKLRVVK